MPFGDLPLGPLIDAAPRPLPARIRFAGIHAILEPLHRRHAADLWAAMVDDDASWTYLPYGPFADEAALIGWIDDFAARHDPMLWAVRSVVSGRAVGWLGLLDIQPTDAAIELGHIWFGPDLRRTRAATEAMALLLRYAADDLGYGRLVWKCDSLNAASIRAAKRLGFRAEGVLRAHRKLRGRRRDTAMHSIVGEEWAACAAALRAWLEPGNFAADGTARHGLADLRAGGE